MPRNGRPNITLPPKAIDFGQPLSLPQAVVDIQQAGQQLTLNRVSTLFGVIPPHSAHKLLYKPQFQRIQSMCLSLYQKLSRREGDRRESY